MPNSLDALNASKEVRVAHHVAYSLHILAEITTGYDQAVDEGQFLTARCMVDAFYVHLRLMAEFLVKNPRDDIGPHDFGVKWTKPDCTEARNLIQYHDDASKYVVHFGSRRVPVDLDDLASFDIGGAHWQERLTDVVAVFQCFLTVLENLASEWDQDVLLPNPEVEPDAWRQRLRWEQAQILGRALDDARSALQL